MGLRYHCYSRVDWHPAGAATAVQPLYPTFQRSVPLRHLSEMLTTSQFWLLTHSSCQCYLLSFECRRNREHRCSSLAQIFDDGAWEVYGFAKICEARGHSIHISTVSSWCLQSPLPNWFKLVYGLFGQSNMHRILEFCPDQPGTNVMYQS